MWRCGHDFNRRVCTCNPCVPFTTIDDGPCRAGTYHQRPATNGPADNPLIGFLLPHH